MMLRSYIRKDFNTEYVPTVLDMFSVTMSLPNAKITTEIYDTAGQEEFEEIRKLQLAVADMVIVCYSTMSLISLDNVENLWVPELKQLNSNPIPYIFVGTKKDLYQKHDPLSVPYKTATAMGIKHKATEILECSAKEYGTSPSNKRKGNVDKVFKAAVKYGLYDKGLLKKTETKRCKFF